MWEKSVEEKKPSRGERSCHRACAKNLAITDLPISPMEMQDRTFAVATGQNLHAAVVDRCFVEGYPNTDDGSSQGIVKVGMVLMPWFFTTQPRRFYQGHVLEHHRGFPAQKRVNSSEQSRVVREGTQPWFMADKVGELSHGILSLFQRERR